MKSYCLSPADTEWRTILAGNMYDIYHLPEYAAIDARLTKGDAVAICIEEDPFRLLVPLVLEPLPEFCASSSWRDAHSPYGYASPLLLTASGAPPMTEEHSERFLSDAVPRLLDTLKDLHVVTAFIRLHPLLPMPLEPLRRVGELVERGQTVSVDLTLSDAELDRQLRRDHRRDLRELERDGYSASIEEDLSQLGTFREIYTESMQRLHASEFYLFSDDYFRSLEEELAPYVRLGAVRHQGIIVSMDIFTEINGIIQGHLRGTRTEHIKASPAKALTVETQRWAKARGNWIFHMGGGIGRGTQRQNLMQYKLGFSPRTHSYWTWHLVTEPAHYARLIEQWKKSNPHEASGDWEHFPTYRTPMRTGVNSVGMIERRGEP